MKGTYRDAAKNGQHNLGGNIRDTGGYHGGKAAYADGGEVDAFRSNDDGGGGAFAARQSYEAAQDKAKYQPLADRDAAESGTGRMMDARAGMDARDAAESGMSAAAVPKPAPADNSGAPPASTAVPAPSAMPAEVTTLTPAEKKGAAAGAEAAKEDKKEKDTSNWYTSKKTSGAGAAFRRGMATAKKIQSGRENADDQASRTAKRNTAENAKEAGEAMAKGGHRAYPDAVSRAGYKDDGGPTSALEQANANKKK